MTLRTRGFGLVEIMVGLVVGMVCMYVIFKVYSTFEEQKRTTTTGGDAQTNGALALYLMEREIRMAGNGITEGEPQKYPPLAGCLTTVYDNNADFLQPNIKGDAGGKSVTVKAKTEAAIRFAPAIVTDGGGTGAADSVTIVYGSSLITAPYTVLDGYEPGAASISLTSTVGIRQGDMVVLIEEDGAAAKTSANYITPQRCVMLQVTGAPTASTLPVAFNTRYNKVNGTKDQPTFTSEAKLFNLGQVNIVTLRIANGNLVADTTKFGVVPNGGTGTPVTNRATDPDLLPLVSNIVNMQIQYGVDTGSPAKNAEDCSVNAPGIAITEKDADGIVDAWVDAKTIWANNGSTTPALFDLQRIRAVRIGLVARSTVKEVPKPDDKDKYPNYPECSSTSDPIVIGWPSGPSMKPDLSGDKEWQCYRYKVFQTTVPIRNAIWSSSMNPASPASCGLRDVQ